MSEKIEKLLDKMAAFDDAHKTRRVRRKAMNFETFARFCNRSNDALSHVYNEFDPSPREVLLMLEQIQAVAKSVITTTRRKTS